MDEIRAFLAACEKVRKAKVEAKQAQKDAIKALKPGIYVVDQTAVLIERDNIVIHGMVVSVDPPVPFEHRVESRQFDTSDL